MAIDLGRLVNSPIGRILFSIILGLGLAALFKQSCTGQSCITYHGPILGQVENKPYKYGEKCYSYTIVPIQCSNVRRSIEFSNPIDDPVANSAAPEPDVAKSVFSFNTFDISNAHFTK